MVTLYIKTKSCLLISYRDMIENDRVYNFGASPNFDSTADVTFGNIGFLAKFDILEDRAIWSYLLDHWRQALIVRDLLLFVLLNSLLILNQKVC